MQTVKQALKSKKPLSCSDFLRAQIKEKLNTRLELREASLRQYTIAIVRFCDTEKLDPFKFETYDLEDIEDKTEHFIRQNRDVLAPKYLNVIYNAIKSWCYTLKIIKSRKMFREITFDKNSRKVDAITEISLETKHVRTMFQISDAHTKVLDGFYGLMGLRPALIPQLTVNDIDPNDYTIQNGKIKFANKNPFVYIDKAYKGNKAHLTFFAIIPSKITELLELTLNENEIVTVKTPLLKKYRSCSTIHDKIKAQYAKVGFSGRPYLLRSFADKILDRHLKNIESDGTKKDEDLKEFMLGHKGKMSAIYQFKALTNEDKKQYRSMYESVDKWINENIFEMRTSEELNKANAVKDFAARLGVDPNVLNAITEAFAKGALTFEQLEANIQKETDKLLNKQLEAKFTELFKKQMQTMQTQQ